MTYEELKALPLMDAVIRETLRLHPPSIMHEVQEDAVISASLSAPTEDTTYIVPQGYFVLASPAIRQADPRIWKHALNCLLAAIIRRMKLCIDRVPERNYHTMITRRKTPRSISYRLRQ